MKEDLAAPEIIVDSAADKISADGAGKEDPESRVARRGPERGMRFTQIPRLLPLVDGDLEIVINGGDYIARSFSGYVYGSGKSRRSAIRAALRNFQKGVVRGRSKTSEEVAAEASVPSGETGGEDSAG